MIGDAEPGVTSSATTALTIDVTVAAAETLSKLDDLDSRTALRNEAIAELVAQNLADDRARHSLRVQLSQHLVAVRGKYLEAVRQVEERAAAQLVEAEKHAASVLAETRRLALADRQEMELELDVVRARHRDAVAHIRTLEAQLDRQHSAAAVVLSTAAVIEGGRGGPAIGHLPQGGRAAVQPRHVASLVHDRLDHNLSADAVAAANSSVAGTVLRAGVVNPSAVGVGEAEEAEGLPSLKGQAARQARVAGTALFAHLNRSQEDSYNVHRRTLEEAAAAHELRAENARLRSQLAGSSTTAAQSIEASSVSFSAVPPSTPPKSHPWRSDGINESSAPPPYQQDTATTHHAALCSAGESPSRRTGSSHLLDEDDKQEASASPPSLRRTRREGDEPSSSGQAALDGTPPPSHRHAPQDPEEAWRTVAPRPATLGPPSASRTALPPPTPPRRVIGTGDAPLPSGEERSSTPVARTASQVSAAPRTHSQATLLHGTSTQAVSHVVDDRRVTSSAVNRAGGRRDGTSTSLGVVLGDRRQRNSASAVGIEVVDVKPGSVAEAAGIRPRMLLVELDGVELRSTRDVAEVLHRVVSQESAASSAGGGSPPPRGGVPVSFQCIDFDGSSGSECRSPSAAGAPFDSRPTSWAGVLDLPPSTSVGPFNAHRHRFVAAPLEFAEVSRAD